jgi:hypothetical protein
MNRRRMAICPPDLLATIITLFAGVETSKTELFLSIVAALAGLLYHEFNMTTERSFTLTI